jgi:U3 small nucleolar RNA-associated protein 12
MLPSMQVWSLDALPDGSGFVSASADKYIKLWKWTRVEDSGAAARLSAEQDKVINTGQDVLCVKVSPDGNLMAASLISNVIKV